MAMLFIFIFLCIFFIPSQSVVVIGTGGLVFWPFLQTALDSYKLIQPDFDLIYVPQSNGIYAISTFLVNASFDFAVIDANKPTPEQFQGGLQIFPWLINTIVPQINLAFNQDIVLNRSVVADIFMGKITNWNHSAITSTNPGKTFPNTTIKVFYRKDVQALNTLWSAALASFSDEWNKTYGISAVWPLALQNLSNFYPYSSAVALNGAVASITNSIGYSANYLVARDPTLYYAHIIHKNSGIALPCNGNTTQAAANGIALDAQLWTSYSVDNPDPYAWPLATFHFQMIRVKPKNCENARAFYKFIRWVLTSETARNGITQGGCGALPKNITDVTLATLEKIQCEDGTLISSFDDQFASPLSYGIEDAFFTIAMLILCLGLVLSAVHIYHFSASKINMTYSVVFVIGTTLTLISPLFWLLPPDQHLVCQIRIWTGSLGFAILLGTMFSRTWQLNDIYSLQKHGRSMDALRFKTTTNKTLLQLAFTLLGVIFTNFVILVIWSAVDPLTTHWVMTNDIGLVGYHTCQSNYTTPWLILELFFFLFLLCFGVYVIYNTWSFQRQALLVETRYVLLALYNVIVNICAVVPILAFVNITERVLALVVVVSIDISGGSIICAVLLPRLIQKLELSKTDSKGGSSERKAGSARSPVTGTVASAKRKPEISRTPEEELAKRLEEPTPLHAIGDKGLVIDRDGSVKVAGTSEQIELCPLPNQPVRNTSTEQESEASPRSPYSVERSPRFGPGAIVEEDEDDELTPRGTVSMTPIASASTSPRRVGIPRQGEHALGSFDSESGLLQAMEESSGGNLS